MESRWRWSGILLFLCLPFFFGSCAPQQIETKPAPAYYSTPVITYLKECPGHDCKAVGELYRGDQVEQLEVKEDWWRVRVTRSHLQGWLPRGLLSSEPVPMENYYVAVDSLELRECPSPDCPFRKILLKGDRLEKIAENEQGWLRVLVEKDATIGWVPLAQLSDRPTQPPLKPEPEEKAFLYTAAANVNLYSLPLFSSKIVKTLPLNEKVEKLVQHGKDWFKVRHLLSGAEGWAAARDLKESRVTAEPPKPKRKFRKKPAPKKPSQPEEAPLPEPEPM
ncbi:MAG: SH3 domain-containing protein [Desulfobaccales bacterium]